MTLPRCQPPEEAERSPREAGQEGRLFRVTAPEGLESGVRGFLKMLFPATLQTCTQCTSRTAHAPCDVKDHLQARADRGSGPVRGGRPRRIVPFMLTPPPPTPPLVGCVCAWIWEREFQESVGSLRNFLC